MIQGKDYLYGHRHGWSNPAVHWLRANQVIAGSVLGLILGQLVLVLPPSWVLATIAGGLPSRLYRLKAEDRTSARCHDRFHPHVCRGAVSDSFRRCRQVVRCGFAAIAGGGSAGGGSSGKGFPIESDALLVHPLSSHVFGQYEHLLSFESSKRPLLD